MLTSAIYGRYSSDRQRSTSIDDQLRLCRDAALRFDCTVLEDHIYTDQEISGAVEQRPAYVQMLAAAKAHRFQAVLVESQDRLWRDQGEMHYALKRLRFWGIRVFAVAIGSDLTNRTGRLLASVMGWKDEAYLEDLRDKTWRGLSGQVQRGFSPGGRSYGYRSEPMRNEQDQIVGYQRTINAEEAAVVRRIFELYATGLSPRAVTRVLNDEAIPPPSPPRRQRRRGWTQATIAGSAKRAIGILHNPLYIGRIVWNRHQKMLDPDTGKRIMRLRPRSEWQWAEAPDLRIVPHELWEAVQARRKGRKPGDWSMVPGHRPSALLSGILLCAECGSRYVLNNRRYYGCAAHRDRGPAICANSKLARRDRVEEGLVRIILQELFSPEVMAYVTHRVNWALARMMETPDENRRRRGRELDEAQRELDNIVAAIRQGVVTPTTKALLEECERRVAAGEAALRDSPPAPAPIAALPRVVEGYLTQLRTTLATDTDAARGLISKLVGTVPLKRVGDRLIGEVRGNLSGLLDLAVANDGSGGWI